MTDKTDIAIKDMEPMFLRAAQAVIATIAAEHQSQQLSDCDSYDMFYFGCV